MFIRKKLEVLEKVGIEYREGSKKFMYYKDQVSVIIVVVAVREANNRKRV